jgi:hypothetical protein
VWSAHDSGAYILVEGFVDFLFSKSNTLLHSSISLNLDQSLRPRRHHTVTVTYHSYSLNHIPMRANGGKVTRAASAVYRDFTDSTQT